jgi:type IV pilus assembly protein PilM
MLAEKFSSVVGLFESKSPALVGVDISSTSVKLVELAEAGKGAYRLERYTIEPLPREAVTDGNIVNMEQVS